MIDLLTARKTFLSAFPSQYRDHIIAFAKNLSTLDVDVLVLTARKAVCLFHCLEYLGLFVPGKRLVISERWMDHDRSWLANKRVAIIDEVIVTGTSIYRLNQELEKAGVSNVQVHCLFVNGSYFVEDFFKNIALSRSYIKLTGEEAQALSTAIVEAMYTIPRPYSVDYPMSTWTKVSKAQLSRLKALPGWQTVERHWMAPDRISDRNKVAYFRITPREELAFEIDQALGANIFSRCLIKIRLYGYFSGSGTSRNFFFRIVPYVVLGELAVEDFNHVFAQLVSQLTLSDQEIAMTSCVTEESRLRLIQYVLSGRLAEFWISQLAAMDVPVSFRQDSAELNYIFPSSLHEIIEKLTHQIRVPRLSVRWPERHVGLNPNILVGMPERKDSPTYYRLVEPFSKMYHDKELSLRKLALELGKEIFTSSRYKDLLNRLDKGISVDNLREHSKSDQVGVSESVLSDFLDLGIDSGVVVPITACSTINGTKHIYRAYRHGEETPIVDRDLAMFHAMLDTFAKVWRPTGKAADESSALIPKIVVEKLLVLFMRYAVGSDLLRTSYERLDTDTVVGVSLNVGYHRHGARLSTELNDPTEFTQDRAFVNVLVTLNILKKTQSGGYSIPEFLMRDVLDAKRRSAATKFGDVLAKALSVPPHELVAPHNDVDTARSSSQSKTRTDILVAMSTCETGGSTLLAVGAELRLFCEFFSRGFALPVGNINSALSKLQSSDARFFLNNAMKKIDLHLDRVAATAADRLRELLGEDSLAGAVWAEIWETAVQHKSIDEEREANKQLLLCLRTVWQLDFNIQLLVLGILKSQGRPTEATRQQLDKIIEKVGSRATELGARAITNKNSAAAMSAFAKMASGVESRLKATLSRWDRQNGQLSGLPRLIAEELDRQRSVAASLFVQIDNRYRDRNRLSEVERFENILVMRVNLQPSDASERETRRRLLERGLVRELQNYVTRANGQDKPRTYRGKAATAAIDSIIQVQTVKSDSYLDIRMTGRGPETPSWFGHIVGKFLSYDNYAAIEARTSWISILGLDETREYSRASDTDEFVGTPLVDHLISDELASGDHEGRLIVAGGPHTREAMCKAFQEEYSAVRKSLGAARLAVTDLNVDALGGTATVCTYGAESQPYALRQIEGADVEAAVLVLATEWSSHHGGLSTFNRMLCKAIGQLGIKVACAVQEASVADIEDARRHKVQLIVSSADPGAPPISGLFRSFQLPLGFRPNIVIGHGRVTGYVAKAQVADRFHGAQRVHFVHMAPGEIEWYKPNDDTTRKAEDREDIERVLSEGASLVAAVGERLFSEVQSIVAGSKTPLHLFEPGLMEQSDTELLLRDHCLLLGRAEDLKLKGVDIAAQAIGRVANERSLPGREIELVVRGAVSGTGDALRNELIAFCLGADVQIRIREFKAGDDAVERDLKRASVVLMPSRREGFGLVALEAISAGVPILVTDKSGMAAMIKRHAPNAFDNVVVVTTDDLETSSLRWAKAIEFVLRDKAASFLRAKELRTELAHAVSWTGSIESMMQRLQVLRRTNQPLPVD